LFLCLPSTVQQQKNNKQQQQVTAAYHEEIARVNNSGTFADIRVKHQKNIEENLAAPPEKDRDAARHRWIAEAQ
jgi:hypothetical protein